MRNKKAFALYVKSILKLRKWKPTILFLGMMEVKLLSKIVKCSANMIIE